MYGIIVKKLIINILIFKLQIIRKLITYKISMIKYGLMMRVMVYCYEYFK